MISSLVIGVTRVIVFALVIVCGIVSMYAATDAISVYAGHSLFVAGLFAIGLAVLLNPLFCFIAIYGLKWRLGIPVVEAVVIVVPLLLVWCVGAYRTVFPATTPR